MASKSTAKLQMVLGFNVSPGVAFSGDRWTALLNLWSNGHPRMPGEGVISFQYCPLEFQYWGQN